MALSSIAFCVLQIKRNWCLYLRQRVSASEYDGNKGFVNEE